MDDADSALRCITSQRYWLFMGETFIDKSVLLNGVFQASRSAMNALEA
jgi:hypothetical protein